MTREEAIELLCAYGVPQDEKRFQEAIDMAIEALQFAEHFDLLKEYQSLKEVVRCKDCRYYDDSCEVCRCSQWDLSRIEYPMVEADGFCSYGERREP